MMFGESGVVVESGCDEEKIEEGRVSGEGGGWRGECGGKRRGGEWKSHRNRHLKCSHRPHDLKITSPDPK